MTDQQWQTLGQSLSGLPSNDKRELANRLLHSLDNGETEEQRTQRQYENMMRPIEEIEKIPSPPNSDGFSNRDDDRVTY